MTKWITPAPYFGPFFGSGAGVVPGQMSASLTGGSSLTADLTSTGDALTDRQAFRIYNLRKKKRKPRVELVLDMDVQERVELAPLKVSEPVAVRIQPVTTKHLRVTALDLAMVRPMEVKVRPRPVFNPIQPLVVLTAEDERKKKSNHALRLLLLAS